MKKNPARRLTALVIAVVLLAAAVPAGAAVTDIYVNGSADTLGTDLASAYVLGSGGVSRLGSSSVYVMTSSGLSTIGGAAPSVSTVIDRTKYVDGSRYNNTPVNLSTVRVGLFFGNTALEQAKLLNAVGSGYSFGYYDSDKIFREVGYTAERALTMIKDTNVSVDNVGVIGCYHVRLNQTFPSFEAAKTAAAAYQGGFPAYYNGSYYVLIGQYTSQQAAAEALSALGVSGAAYSASNRCVVVTRSDTKEIIFEFDGGSAASLAVVPRSTGEKTQTWFKGYKYYGAFQYTRLDGGDLTVVNFVDLEDYVKGVIPYEMTPSWPIEAQKAQALCARTYVATHLNGYKSYGFDVTNDTRSQVYRGTSGANSISDSAVDATAGQYVRYEGKLCSTFYSSSDGGGTESSGNVFATDYPYLKGVIDPFEEAIDFKYKTWSYTYTGADIGSKLKAKGYNIGTVTAVDTTMTETGNCIRIVYRDASGRTATFAKTGVYGSLGFPSMHFKVTQSGSTFTFEGGGWGHNCGMSQWGAYSMAKVYGYNAEDIIRFYFTGAYIA